jgi:hypothetical protein
MPVVGGVVEANSGDCGFICNLERNFNLFKDTDVFFGVDGEVAVGQG